MRLHTGVSVVALIALGFVTTGVPTIAHAQIYSPQTTTHTTKHHKKTKHTHKQIKHKTSHKKTVKAQPLREAQKHLINLGYYAGSADGVMGPKTKSALKAFQLDQNLHVTGTLTKETERALAKADYGHVNLAEGTMKMPAAPAKNFYATHPDFYGHTDQQYADPMLMSRNDRSIASPAQSLPNRFAQVDVVEENGGGVKRYNVTVNNQPILVAENQPSIIGISSTYQVGNNDAIIFSTYDPNDQRCAYKHHLLVLKSNDTQLLPIDNCTREYKAGVTYDMLVISFPEIDSGRSVGATWRYDGESLQRL